MIMLKCIRRVLQDISKSSVSSDILILNCEPLTVDWKSLTTV